MLPEPSIYFDHNAMAPPKRVALSTFLRVQRRVTGNSSSIHRDGMRARAELDEARSSIVESLSIREGQLIFTSGGTEANNLAILGAQLLPTRQDIAISPIEHPSVTAAARAATQHRNSRLRVLPTTEHGTIDLQAIENTIDDRIGLVSIQAANHETGVVQPIEAIAAALRGTNSIFHCDAVQYVGRRPAAALCASVDALTLAAHKLGGLPGIGALWVKDPSRFSPILHGGAQEHGLRAGTTSPALAAAFAAALRESIRTADHERERISSLRTHLLEGIRAIVPDTVFFSTARDTLENTLCLAFPGIDRFALTIQLDLSNVRVSPGAACSSGSPEPSPVLQALGVPPSLLRSAIRLSLGTSNDREQVSSFLERLPRIVDQCRADSLRFSTRA